MTKGKPEVVVPPREYAVDAAMRALWIKSGLMIDDAREGLAFEAVVSVLLSRLTREMRRSYGTAYAKQVLQRFVETMEQSARNDLT